MSKYQTEQKLELIRAIRLQNQYDRQILNRHENILYKDPKGRSELYSLEDTALLPAMNGKHKGKTELIRREPKEHEGGGFLSGTRLRLALAMILFLLFVYCDVKGVSPIGKTTDEVLNILQEDSLKRMTENFEDTGIFSSLEMQK